MFVTSPVAKALAIVPNVFAAFVIGFVGWLLGNVATGLVTNILVAAGADGSARNLGLDPRLRISQIVGTLVLILVFVPALIAALDVLQLEAISRPATDMLGKLLAAVPNIIAAALILAITYCVARFAAGLLARLLAAVGFDSLPGRLGLTNVFAGGMPPSRLVSLLVLVVTMLFATAEAANRLEFTQVRDLVAVFIRFGSNVILGAVILIIGSWLANVAHGAIKRANTKHSDGLAGIADDIVNLAFMLTFGAVAVAAALSFGLGGREAGGRAHHSR